MSRLFRRWDSKNHLISWYYWIAGRCKSYSDGLNGKLYIGYDICVDFVQHNKNDEGRQVSKISCKVFWTSFTIGCKAKSLLTRAIPNSLRHSIWFWYFIICMEGLFRCIELHHNERWWHQGGRERFVAYRIQMLKHWRNVELNMIWYFMNSSITRSRDFDLYWGLSALCL